MLREEPKKPPRVRICGDLAKYLDEEDLLALQQPNSVVAEEAAIVVAVEPAALAVSNLCLMEAPEEMQAA
jgi:hypothetical protein